MKCVFLLLSLAFCQVSARPLVAQDAAPKAKGDPFLVDSLIEAAGGRGAYAALPGLRYQVLETRWITPEEEEATGQGSGEQADAWRVHHRVPHLVHLTLLGDGFRKSEFVDMSQAGALYRRQVRHGDVAWSERSGQYDRSPGAVAAAGSAIGREFFLGAMPFSLEIFGASTQFQGVEEVAGRALHLYTVELEQPVVLEDVEKIDELLLFVDPEEQRVVQLKWRFTGADRLSMKPIVWAHVDFEGTREVDGVRLPHVRRYWRADSSWYLDYVVEDVRAAEVPGPALRRPWIAGVVYETSERADHWDPPPRSESSGEGGASEQGGQAEEPAGENERGRSTGAGGGQR